MLQSMGSQSQTQRLNTSNKYISLNLFSELRYNGAYFLTTKKEKWEKKMSSLLETVLAQWSRVGVVSFNWQIIGLGHYVTQDRNPLFISSGPVSSVINVEISTRLLQAEVKHRRTNSQPAFQKCALVRGKCHRAEAAGWTSPRDAWLISQGRESQQNFTGDPGYQRIAECPWEQPMAILCAKKTVCEFLRQRKQQGQAFAIAKEVGRCRQESAKRVSES